MNNELITMKETFDQHVYEDINGDERFSARDLQRLLGYKSWQKFTNILERAKTSCSVNNYDIDYHFIHLDKMVNIGSAATRTITDYALSRYACYTIAMCGDTRKKQIAFAQAYFYNQIRTLENIQDTINTHLRHHSRDNLRGAISSRNTVIYDAINPTNMEIAIIHSEGDRKFYNGYSTQDMKDRYGIPKHKPLDDMSPRVVIDAKTLASSMTEHNIKTRKLDNYEDIKNQHISSNDTARMALVSQDIIPEELPPEEDILKVERRIVKGTKELAKIKKKD